MLAALLNFVPGFGTGYLVIGQTRAFVIAALVWAVPAGLIAYGIVGAKGCSGGLECLGWIVPVLGGLIVGFAINVTCSIDALVRLAKRVFR